MYVNFSDFTFNSLESMAGRAPTFTMDDAQTSLDWQQALGIKKRIKEEA